MPEDRDRFGLVDRKLASRAQRIFRKPNHSSFRYVKGQYLRTGTVDEIQIDSKGVK